MVKSTWGIDGLEILGMYSKAKLEFCVPTTTRNFEIWVGRLKTVKCLLRLNTYWKSHNSCSICSQYIPHSCKALTHVSIDSVNAGVVISFQYRYLRLWIGETRTLSGLYTYHACVCLTVDTDILLNAVHLGVLKLVPDDCSMMVMPE